MRPSHLLQGNTLFWVIRLVNSSGVLVDADSTPTVTVRKNGAAVGDAVTVTKRASTTGIYDCSYNPAGEVEGDQYTMEETAIISGVTYQQNWEFSVRTQLSATAITNIETVFVTDIAGAFATVAAGITSVGSDVTTIKDIVEAQKVIDTSTTPWQVVLIKAGTGGLGVGVELLRQALKDEAGNDVTDINTFLGQSVDV